MIAAVSGLTHPWCLPSIASRYNSTADIITHASSQLPKGAVIDVLELRLPHTASTGSTQKHTGRNTEEAITAATTTTTAGRGGGGSEEEGEYSQQEVLEEEVRRGFDTGIYRFSVTYDLERHEATADSGSETDASAEFLKYGSRFDRDADPHSVLQTQLAERFVYRSPLFGVSAYTLLTLGLIPMQRKQLLKLYVDLPLWSLDGDLADDVTPWSLYVRPASSAVIGTTKTSDMALWYHPLNITTATAHVVAAMARRRRHLTASGSPASSHLPKLSLGVKKQAAAIISRIIAGSDPASLESGLGVSTGHVGSASDRSRAKMIWQALQAEFESHRGDLAGGK